jgi:hypothetical protein
VKWLVLVTAVLVAALLVMSPPAGLVAPSLHAQTPTSIGVDVVPSGNTATSIGNVQACASAQQGDSFIVDILITVNDLLAWELPVSYNPDVLEVTGRDVQKQFQSANPGSQILDLSDKVPDDDGRYELQAVDTADPPSPDSGNGILARLTLKARGPGISPLGIAPVDLDGDNKPDRGILLRQANGDIAGDVNGDSIFDGPALDAEIRVGQPCPGADSKNTVQTVESGSDQDSDGEATNTGDGAGGADTALIVGAALAAVTGAALLAFLALLLRRRRATPS